MEISKFLHSSPFLHHHFEVISYYVIQHKELWLTDFSPTVESAIYEQESVYDFKPHETDSHVHKQWSAFDSASEASYYFSYCEVILQENKVLYTG